MIASTPDAIGAADPAGARGGIVVRLPAPNAGPLQAEEGRWRRIRWAIADILAVLFSADAALHLGDDAHALDDDEEPDTAW